MKQFQESVINWLLEENNPPLRYLTLKNLLKDSKAAQENKSHIMAYEVYILACPLFFSFFLS